MFTDKKNFNFYLEITTFGEFFHRVTAHTS